MNSRKRSQLKCRLNSLESGKPFFLWTTLTINTSTSRDTVDSVGIIPKRLPFTTSNTIVRTFRHAISLDERRAKFKANLWNRPTPEEAQLGVSLAPELPPRATSIDEPEPQSRTGTGKYTKYTPNVKKAKTKHKEDESDRKLNTLERKYSEKSERTTDIEEVWFAVRLSVFSVHISHPQFSDDF